MVILARLGVLGTTFEEIKWASPFPPLTLGIAFLLGFSERFFDQVTSLLELRTEVKQQNVRKTSVETGQVREVTSRQKRHVGDYYCYKRQYLHQPCRYIYSC
jgi:hypothetical protein